MTVTWVADRRVGVGVGRKGDERTRQKVCWGGVGLAGEARRVGRVLPPSRATMTDGVGAGGWRSVAGIIKYLLTTMDDLPTIAYDSLLGNETQPTP